MTRFARAKGSKASNERLPNEATPWNVMKQQIEEVQIKEGNPSGKAKSAKELLREKEEPYYANSISNLNTDWAQFDDHSKSHDSSLHEVNNGRVKKLKTKIVKEKTKLEKNLNKVKSDNVLQSTIVVDKEENDNGGGQDTQGDDKKNKKKRKLEEISKNNKLEKNLSKVKSDKDVLESTIVMDKKENDNREAQDKQGDDKKNKKKRKAEEINKVKSVKLSLENEKKKKDHISENSNDNKVLNKEKMDQIPAKLSKRQKRNWKKKIQNANEKGNYTHAGFNTTDNDWSTDVVIEPTCNNNNEKIAKTEKNSEGRKWTDETKVIDRPVFNEKNNSRKPFNNENFKNKSQRLQQNSFRNKNRYNKPGKIRDDKEHPRRKPDVGPLRMTINGVDLELVKYDGFPIRKDDADRLKELRKNMVLKGIPKSEIDAAMKLERRKAEKALARIRKQVCFHCRKSGHNLSDCPELCKEENGTGICFKCGSTEHTHFECKITKSDDYRYASCFICRERGHIAKQCPDNPKGLYPQGGACKTCGDVTHLMKDCPDLAKKKEETSITVNTISNSTLELLDEELKNKNHVKISEKVKNKVVKF